MVKRPTVQICQCFDLLQEGRFGHLFHLSLPSMNPNMKTLKTMMTNDRKATIRTVPLVCHKLVPLARHF